MSERAHQVAAVVMAAIGVLVFVVAITIQLVGAVRGHAYEIPHTVFYAGMVIGFVGFYGLDPKRAKDGGQFIVSSAAQLIQVIRTGRRSTDVAAITAPTQEQPATPKKDDVP